MDLIAGNFRDRYGLYQPAEENYRAIVEVPDNMSDEQYERIRQYGGDLDLTPGTESDVILTLERTHDEYVSRPDDYIVLAQFSCCPLSLPSPRDRRRLRRRRWGSATETWPLS